MSTAIRHETIPIAIPPRVAQRPRHGNVPILFVTYIRADGVPDFRINDSQQVRTALRDRLCAICGQRLDYWMVFIAKPDQVADARLRGSSEPAMHEECVRYAIAVCPYLLGTRARRERGLPESANTEIYHRPHRPERMVLGWTRGYKIVPHSEYLYAIPQAFKRVEEF